MNSAVEVREVPPFPQNARKGWGTDAGAQPFLAGTFFPALRASDSPIAMACFLLVTFLPLRPLFNFPCFIARISVSTLFPAAGEYLRVDFLPVAFFFVVLVAIASPCLVRWLRDSLRLSRCRAAFESLLRRPDLLQAVKDLVEICHRGVEAVEYLLEFSGFGGKAEGLDVFYADFGRGGLLLEDLHDFGDELIQGHGARILGAVHQVSLHVRRDQLQHLDAGGAKLVAERKRVGVDAGLGGAIGGRKRERQKRQAGRDV